MDFVGRVEKKAEEGEGPLKIQRTFDEDLQMSWQMNCARSGVGKREEERPAEEEVGRDSLEEYFVPELRG
jgi:hypothetical protein